MSPARPLLEYKDARTPIGRWVLPYFAKKWHVAMLYATEAACGRDAGDLWECQFTNIAKLCPKCEQKARESGWVP